MNNKISTNPLTTILVADDERSFRYFLTKSMYLEGYEVVSVDNGGDALNVLSEPNSPSLAILDWNMPILDGIEVCRRIREFRDHGLLYVIMITGGESKRDVVAALDAGADDYLQKPFRRDELLARVRAGRRILKLSHEKLTMMRQLQSQQHLESIGQLAAGIAHEINTPMQYIGDNTRFIQDALTDIMEAVRVLTGAFDKVKNGDNDIEALKTAEETLETADLDFIREQVPLALTQSLDGIDRVTKIVQAMKEFAHPGTGEAMLSDINHLLETAITVTRNEWKYVAEISTDFSPSLPSVPCYPGDFNQAIINLIVNAAHAIQEKQTIQGTKEKGSIRIETQCLDNGVEVRITDTGCGIPIRVRDRIMEPFFTTKELGKGTGQGLAIARSSIVDKQGGSLRFETEEGFGTTFFITIPLSRSISLAEEDYSESLS